MLIRPDREILNDLKQQFQFKLLVYSHTQVLAGALRYDIGAVKVDCDFTLSFVFAEE